MMRMKYLILLLIPKVLGFFKVETENFTIDYIDNKYLIMKPTVYKLHRNNALNLLIKPNVNLMETTKIKVKAFKLLSADYWVPIIQFDKTLKNALEMERFDMQSLLVHHANPPLIWPLQKDVTYYIQGWVPDSSKYPPNMPDGKWKFETSIIYVNKTTLAILTYFANIENTS